MNSSNNDTEDEDAGLDNYDAEAPIHRSGGGGQYPHDYNEVVDGPVDEEDPVEIISFTDEEEELFQLMVKIIKFRVIGSNPDESVNRLNEIIENTDLDNFVYTFIEEAITVADHVGDDGEIPDTPEFFTELMTITNDTGADSVFRTPQAQVMRRTSGRLAAPPTEKTDRTSKSAGRTLFGHDLGAQTNAPTSASDADKCLIFKHEMSKYYFSESRPARALPNFPDFGDLNPYVYLDPDSINDKYQQRNKINGMGLMSTSLMTSASPPSDQEYIENDDIIRLTVNPFYGHRRLYKLPASYDDILEIVGDGPQDKLNIFTALGKTFNDIRIVPGTYDDAYKDAYNEALTAAMETAQRYIGELDIALSQEAQHEAQLADLKALFPPGQYEDPETQEMLLGDDLPPTPGPVPSGSHPWVYNGSSGSETISTNNKGESGQSSLGGPTKQVSGRLAGISGGPRKKKEFRKIAERMGLLPEDGEVESAPPTQLSYPPPATLGYSNDINQETQDFADAWETDRKADPNK